MKKAYCVYRIDDVAPGMDWEKFNKFMNLFQKYRIVPLIGVVPDNRDPNLTVGKVEASFWKIIKRLKEEGKVEVAQHGYQHIYTTRQIQGFYRFCGFKAQSEFHGVSYKKQYEMIKAGKEICLKNGIEVDIFMAPGHSFDKNTIRALKALNFRAVTDGIGLFPVKKRGLVFVPQQSWAPGKARIGVKTVCLHLNSADEELYRLIERHLKSDHRVVPFSRVLRCRNSMSQSILNLLYKGFFVFKLSFSKMLDRIRNE